MRKGIWKRVVTYGMVSFLLMISVSACGKRQEAVITSDEEDMTQAEKEYPTMTVSNQKTFSFDDLFVENVKFRMTEDEVRAVLGEPVNSYDSNEKGNADGIIKEKVLAYNELTLIFSYVNNKYILTAAASVSESHTFARDMHVGDSVDKIYDKYYRDADCMNHIYYTEDKTAVMGRMLYGKFTMDALDTIKPIDKVEYGVINYNGYSSLESAESYMVEFTYFEPPYKEGYATAKDDFAQIAFDIDQNGKITAIRWYYYPEE